MNTVREIKKPYLLMIGDMENPRNAKTAFGLRDWASKDCIGQLRFDDRAVDLGLPQMSPQEAALAGVRTLARIIREGGSFSADGGESDVQCRVGCLASER